MSDNVAVLAGDTHELVLISLKVDLLLPGTDLEDRFGARDTDNQELIIVTGWLFSPVDED